MSDLWGKQNSDWVTDYIELLQNKFDVHFYDCCELGEIDTRRQTQELIHQLFLMGGIERAIKNLLEKEKEEVSVIGFSLGGLIAWKAALLGLKAKYICAVSSTRLRYETEKPQGEIELFFAENDPNKPGEDWFRLLRLEKYIIEKENHEFYKKKNRVEKICQKLIAGKN